MATTYNYGIRLSVDGEGQVVSATGRVGQGFKDMGAEADRGAGLANNLISKLGALATAYVGINTIKQFIDTADAMNGMDGRLRNVIKSTADYTVAQADIYRISQQNNVSLKDTATLYTRLYDPVVKLGGGVREVTLMTEALSTGLRINNATAAESSSAIQQFSQAMASGVLRGEEYNSVNEAAPGFMRAFAESLGVSQGELRKMAEEGKLTADVVGNAMPAAMKILQAQAAGLPETVGGAMSDLRNDASLLAQQLDNTTGATAGLADVITAGAGLVREFTNVLRDNAGATNVAGQGFDTAGAAIRVAGTIAETVLLVFSDVSFMLKGIGREAGGLAAQIVAVASGNFAEAKRIGDEMRADAATARAELTKYQDSVSGMTSRVLQSRDALKNHSLSAAENSTEMARLGNNSNNTAGGYVILKAATTGSAEADKAKKAALKELADQETRQGELLLELSGYSKDYALKTRDLSALYAKGKIDLDTFTKAHDDLLKKQPGNVAQQKLLTDELVRTEKATAEAIKANSNYTASVEKKNTGLDDEIDKQRAANEELAGSTGALKANTADKYLAAAAAADRAALVALERNEDVAQYDALKAQADKYRELAGLKENSIYLTEAKKARDEWDKTTKSIGDGLTDSLFRAFESGKGFWSTLWDGVTNTFKTTILKPIIQDVVSPFAQAFSGVAAGINQTVIQPIVKDVFGPLWGWFGDVAKSINETILQPIMKNVIAPLWGWFTDIAADIGRTILSPGIKNVAAPFLDSFTSAASSISSQVITPTLSTNGLGVFFDALKSGFSTVVGWFSNGLSGVLSGIGSSLGSLFGGGGASAVGSGSSWLSSLGSIGSAVSSGASTVMGWLGMGSGAAAAGAGMSTASYASMIAASEAGIYTGAATAAGGTGVMSAIGAAAPYIAAAVAIVSLLSKKGGGPKVEGAFNSSGAAGIPGGGELNGQAAQLFAGVQSTYSGLAQALGGTAGTLTGATFIGKDPKGTAQTQFVLDAAMNGREIYSRNNRSTGGNVEDVGRTDGELGTAIDNASYQAVLRALQETDINADINARIDAISASMGAEAIKAELAAVLQYKQQQDAAANPVTAPGSVPGLGSDLNVSVSADVLALYGRIAVASELAAVKVTQLQTWVYEAANGNADRVRQALYDLGANDTTTRNAVVEAVGTVATQTQHLQAWLYDSASSSANLVRQALYDLGGNDITTRNAIVGELQATNARLDAMAQRLDNITVHTRDTSDTLTRATQGQPWINTKAA